MAKTAINHLQEQIEAVRREAYAAGYAAAMQSIREFAAKQVADGEPDAAARQRRSQSGPRPGSSSTTAPASGQGQPRGTARPRQRGRLSAQRPQRGTNARFVEEVLQANAPRALRPAEIRTAIQRDNGVAMAFTSIRHALGQLESRRAAEQVADSKTWRYRAGGAAEPGAAEPGAA